jgi:xanthine dehydrogenase iron-sulfur cluster and FAD-binding subunit A
VRLSFTVNGAPVEVDVEPAMRLIDLLRDELGLTGTKEGCSQGECGACTVIVDGRAVDSCLVLATQVRGRSILTVEGLSADGALDALQQAFVEHGAVQCGFCTPGMLMSAKALLMAEPHPSEGDVRRALAGNLCRCTGYTAIVRAVEAAGRSAQKTSAEPAAETHGDGVRAAGRRGFGSHEAGGSGGENGDGNGGGTGGGERCRARDRGGPGNPRVGRLPGAEVRRPASLDELSDALGAATASTRLLAGGTDLVRMMTERSCRPDLVIDLSGVADLASVRLEAGRLRVGAMATLADLQANVLVRRHTPCLAQAAGVVGSVQVRNMATIGGNVANASPCGDTIPALVALGATARVLDPRGRIAERPVEEVVTGQGTTSLSCGEALIEFVVPTLDDGCRAGFVKLGARSTVTVARISMALAVRYDAQRDILSDARVALGALGATVFRDADLEALLESRRAGPQTALLFCSECAAAVRRAIPDRASLAYKEQAVRGLAADAWNSLGFHPVEEQR